MSEINVPKRRGRSCLVYGLVGCFLLPILAIACVLVVFAIRDSAAQKRLTARMDSLRSQGMPIDNQSLAQFYESRTSAIDQTKWLTILAELESAEFRESTTGVPILGSQVTNEIPLSGQPWEEEAATREFLDKWRDLHDRIMRLSMDSVPVRFPIDWQSFSTLLPQTQQMRSAARLLSLRGHVALHDRDSAAVRRSIDALLGCGNVNSGEPILVSQLVAIAIDGMAIEITKVAVEQGILRPKDLRDLLPKILEKSSIGPSWKLAIQGERGLTIPIFKDPSGIFNPNETMIASLPFRATDANNYLDLIDGVLETKTEDFDTFRQSLARQEEKLRELISGGLLAKFDSVVTGMITPALMAAGDAFVRQATAHRMAALGMAIRLYEFDNGRFPRSLNDLQPYGITGDLLLPAGGTPFGYKVEADRATLWGFDLRRESAVPPEPPELGEDEPYRQETQMWVWEMPAASASEQ